MGDKLAKMAAPAMLAPRSMDELGRLCAMLAKARGFVPAAYVGNAEAIGAAIVTGMELGLGPMQSLREIHVIEGKPTLSAHLMLSLAIRAGVKPQWMQSDANGARLRLTREGFEPHVQSFTMEDAKAAGLTRKPTWQRHPAAMLRARCISAAMRAYCPDVLGGSVYVTGELDDSDDCGPPDDHEPPPRGTDGDVYPDPQGEPDADVLDVEPEPALDERLAEAEASCSGEAPASDEPAAPTRLDECADEAQVAAWVRANERHRKHPRFRAKVLARLANLGLDESDASERLDEWLGQEAA